MKRIMSRSFLVLILAIAFFLGICLLAFRVITQNADWVQQPFNGHMNSTYGIASAGIIYDRDGNKLAYTDTDGKRRYIL